MKGEVRATRLSRVPCAGLAILIGLVSVGCDQDLSKSALFAKRGRMERQLGTFDPLYFKVAGHAAISFSVVNGELRLSGVPKGRPGPLPFGSSSSGDTRVRWLDEDGTTLGEYRMDDPLLRRSCEGPGLSATALIENGELDILVPPTQGIHTLEVRRPGVAAESFDLSRAPGFVVPL